MSKKHEDVKQHKKGVKQTEAKDFEALYKRALADYQNLQRQTIKEKEEFATYAKAGVIMDMIPVYENLVSAVSYADENTGDQWITGVKYVIKQFEDILAQNGISIIDPVGETFDHAEHEAVEQVETGDKKRADTVAKVVKRGYKLNDRVLQPAQVSVYVLKNENSKE